MTGFRFNENGSTLPLTVGIVLLVLILLMATLTTAEMAAERVRQQASADLTALAGANALSKSVRTGRLIDFTIWARNLTLDAMYVAATAVTAVSAGLGAEAFAVPFNFQQVTIKPVEALEQMKQKLEKAAPVYAAAKSLAVVKGNGGADRGLAIPLSVITGPWSPGQKYLDLVEMIKTYETRLKLAKGELDQVLIGYRRKQTELAGQGLSPDQIKDDPEMKELTKKLHETSGRVGGLTAQRNRRQRELAELEKAAGGTARPADGVLGIVYHPSSRVPFSSVFGGIETGNNAALAMAKVVDGPQDEVIGEEAVKALLDRTGVGFAAKEVEGMMTAINTYGQWARRLDQDYGPLGGYLKQALDDLKLIPPNISEVRPVLYSDPAVIDKARAVEGLINVGEELLKNNGI